MKNRCCRGIAEKIDYERVRLHTSSSAQRKQSKQCRKGQAARQAAQQAGSSSSSVSSPPCPTTSATHPASKDTRGCIHPSINPGRASNGTQQLQQPYRQKCQRKMSINLLYRLIVKRKACCIATSSPPPCSHLHTHATHQINNPVLVTRA